jgi:hypothetical protein
MDKNCKEYCNCAAEAMARGANRDWVDGTQDKCPLKPTEEMDAKEVITRFAKRLGVSYDEAMKKLEEFGKILSSNNEKNSNDQN